MQLNAARVGRRLAKILKMLAKSVGVLVLIALTATTLVVLNSGDPDFHYPQPANLVNDITGLNAQYVANVIAPKNLDEIVSAIRSTTGPVSIGGGRFSQGGQVAYPDSLHLDMREFDAVVALDEEARLVTVQPGITWRKLQQYIDPYDLSVKIMQTYADFTVGGSLSVNVHGRYIGDGPLVLSVASIRLVLADGSLVTASPEQNRDLFFGAIGGYGGLGVIVEATLQLDENVRIERLTKKMPLEEYGDYFKRRIRDNPDVVFHNADIYPPAYENVRDVSWYKTDKPVTIEDRLIPEDIDYWWQPAIARFVAASDFGKVMREHVLEPLYYLEDRIAWRNWEASYDVRELEPPDREATTYVLREYFVPVANFDAFVPRMAEIFKRNDVNIINVSVRHALPDSGTLLAWAPEEVFAFVVYYRQGTDAAARESVRQWSLQMIDAVIEAGGTWYLPYQVYANADQFSSGYPRSEEFFALKASIDPQNRFRNRLWEQHYPPNRDALDDARQKVENYYRGEEQTFLTIPEWYLVFNPKEYADYLEAGNNPGAFPFFGSIKEYWSLYDRVTTIAKAMGYPNNSEYQTMLWVIGTSTSLEFVVKGAYEATVGRFSRWTAGGQDTPEDLLIAQAHRAYSDLIFQEAWYEFDFGRWIGRIWSETDFFGKNFIRKLERKLAFTAEFAVKTLYARLIKFAAQSTYGVTDKQIYLTASVQPQIAATLPPGVSLIESDGERDLLAVPRWGGFTMTLPKLAEAGYQFEDVSGNRRIVASIIADESTLADELPATTLFESQVVSDERLKRVVVLVSVNELHTFLNVLNSGSAVLEHLYDY